MLLNFSIENDSIVLLQFHDGRNLLVEIEDLPALVSVDDLRHIHEALKRRSEYIQKNLPTWAKVLMLAAIGFVFLAPAAKAAQVVMQMVHQHSVEAHEAQAPVSSNTPTQSTNPAPPPTAALPVANSDSPVSSQGAVANAPSTPNQPASAANPAPVVKPVMQSAAKAAQPIAQPVQTVVEPVVKVLKPVTNIVKPLTAPLGL